MENAPAKPFKRKKVLINQRLQFFIIGYFLIIGALCVLITHTMLKMSINRTLQEFSHVHSIGHNHLVRILQEQSTYYNYVTLALLGLLSVSFFLGGLYLSHRIAGPIYHLQRILRKMVANKSYEEVNFRKSDFLKDLENDFNNYVKYKKGMSVTPNNPDEEEGLL